MGFLSEFKAFAMRGNVIDMAVGIVIGAAFSRIVSSLVADVVMPPLGLLTGSVDFTEKRILLKEAEIGADGVEVVPAVAIQYGVLFTTILDFVLVAFAIFLVVRAMNAARRKEAADPAPPPAPTQQEVLLAEIRDLLRVRA